MENINSCVLAGNLTADAKKVADGIVNFSIANNQRVKDGDEWKDSANYFDFVFYGKRAEAVLPYLKKGQKVCIQAQARQDTWEKDGKKNSRVVFRVDELELLSASKDDNDTPIIR